MVNAADARPALDVPARRIPAPAHLSPAAQAALGAGVFKPGSYPALDDVDGWRAMIAERDAARLKVITGRASKVEAVIEEIPVGHAGVFAITPAGVKDEDQRIYLYVHGGSLVMGGGVSCLAMGRMTAGNVGRRVWALDYRLPPDDPFPAPLDDCLATYRLLLRDRPPEDIIVGGLSAGGNLAAALILRARDEGLPLPSAAVLLSPEVDLTESGDSFSTNQGLDSVITESLMPASLLYAGGHDITDPYLSPLFGDFTKGFPRTFLATGTRDLFLSNTVRMHRALRSAGVPAELHVLEGAPHGFFRGAPEDADLYTELRHFVDERWSH